jgi:repressor LexA
MPKTKDLLSSKQQRILEFIERFAEEKGYPPSIRDIQRGCEISSTSVVDYNLNILESKGYLHRDREVSRGIELPRPAPLARVPILGTIAAGQPLPVPGEESWSTKESAETLELPQELLGGRQPVYGLRVKGMSMIDALIDDGDLVLLQPTNTAENGDMVAVWLKLEQAVTLKRFYRERGRIRLQPANKQMGPLYLRPEDVDIQGRVVGVIRQPS